MRNRSHPFKKAAENSCVRPCEALNQIVEIGR